MLPLPCNHCLSKVTWHVICRLQCPFVKTHMDSYNVCSVFLRLTTFTFTGTRVYNMSSHHSRKCQAGAVLIWVFRVYSCPRERGVWLGLGDVNSPGKLQWVNGSEAQEGEEGLPPRSPISRGNVCVSLDRGSQTSSHPCSTKRACVCQYSPQGWLHMFIQRQCYMPTEYRAVQMPRNLWSDGENNN